MQELYIDVAIPSTVDRLFTYTAPPELQPRVKPGVRVKAPFGKRTVIGIAVNVSSVNPNPAVEKIRPILDVIDAEPLISSELLTLARWIGQYYFAPLGDVLRAMTIEGASSKIGKPKSIDVVTISDASKKIWQQWLAEHSEKKNKQVDARRRVLQFLLSLRAGDVPVTVVLKSARISSSVITSLKKNNVIQTARKEIIRSPSYNTLRESEGNDNIILNAAQRSAVSALKEKIQGGGFHAFLLHGVTGSGKTQVYIEAIREAINAGKSAIVLVPEISLTPQTVRRFHFHFGENVAVFHSRMTKGERYDAWRLAREGRCSIVIGPRSAVFAPVKNLGIIIVDEEHEASYKQFENAPLYHARDVALMRGRNANAVVALGSATPSFESYSNALGDKYTLLELPERVDNARMPEIEIVDMAQERRAKFAAFEQEKKRGFTDKQGMPIPVSRVYRMTAFSDLLRVKIADRLKRGEGIILLQNRRGFSPFIECLDCGRVEMCDNCNISLTYHATKNHLRCHYCGSVKPVPKKCAGCNSSELEYRGIGTQKVEEELTALFPEARVARMDLDTTSKPGAHDAILKKFGRGDVDILLGTQMVAKGLDFPRVTLVGVIDADTQMLLPDFRSAERTFQLLAQVAGRAGRSAAHGEVVLQTFQPKHPGFKHILKHDFPGFYEEEIPQRNELHYPPFARLALIEFSAPEEKDIAAAANAFRRLLAPVQSSLVILGPSPASISKIRNRFRYHIIIKSSRLSDPAGMRLHTAVRTAVEGFREVKFPGRANLRLHIDIDPVGMM